MEYEVDVFPYCEEGECEFVCDDPITVNGVDGETHQWTCPGCGAVYKFEIEFQPDITNFRKAKK